jgi:hypothetical protein
MAWGKSKPTPPKPNPKNHKNKASTHKHNDKGGSRRRGPYIETLCECGEVVARDFAPGD